VRICGRGFSEKFHEGTFQYFNRTLTKAQKIEVCFGLAIVVFSYNVYAPNANLCRVGVLVQAEHKQRAGARVPFLAEQYCLGAILITEFDQQFM